MIYREHNIEIYVNGELLDLESQNINLRLNNTLFDPEKIASTQADYSFSFDVPSTPKNDKIFDYANNLSKLGKYLQRTHAEVYADGHLIFNGTMTVNSFKEKKYNCNLVSVKLYSLDEIFGDSVMTDIPFYIPFSGATEINSMNADSASTVTFPLVSYGAFQKEPKMRDEVANTYTSKFDIDKYNKWWISSFYPSPNTMELVRKAFEWKGYNVGGDAFQDPTLKNVFVSPNLSSEQQPLYNLGNPRIGSVNLTTTLTTSGSGYEQELQFPYFCVDNPQGQFGGQYGQQGEGEAWNWSSIRVYDMMKSGTTTLDDTYMYDPNEKCIVIPADGFYKIELEITSTLNTTGSLNVEQMWVREAQIVETGVTMPVGFDEVTPLEIQLVRNYNDNIELIKGKKNREYKNGNPTFPDASNVVEWYTCFPHEDLYASRIPTKKNDLTCKMSSRRNANGNFGGASTNVTAYTPTDTGLPDIDISGSRSGTGTTGGFGGRGRRNIPPSTLPNRDYTPSSLGYVYGDGEIMAFDQAVSDNFICGFSSFMYGTGAVMKNGYSWSKSNATKNYAFFNEMGYYGLENSGGSIVQKSSDINYNSYVNAPVMTFSKSSNAMTGRICCNVWLNKNDILELFAVQRSYIDTAGTPVNYSTTTTARLKIDAASPKSYQWLKYNKFEYYSPTEFDTDLKVTNFQNNEMKVADWIDGVQKAFNLQINQDGKNIWIDTIKNVNYYTGYAVELDNRCNSANAESSRINYPKSMAVSYKIDDEEWGFERSVTPQSMLNEPNWKDYADSGFTVIKLNDDQYVTEKSEISLPFSYTWYDNFNWFEVDAANVQNDDNRLTLRMPVISKFSYMIDGYDDEECMKHDGYSLSQRFWFRPQSTDAFVWLDSKPSERVEIYLPTNERDGVNLSYKATENSLLKYFNTTPYLASNYVTIEAYINSEEYNDLKNGAMVHFDSDLYKVSEIEGFDPICKNTTKITMIKKVD